jgi:C4-dicarboxylate-binding protein DctP
MKTPRIVKWLITYQPPQLFMRTAKAFQIELDKRIPGEFIIDIMTMKDYIRRIGDVEEMRLRPPEIDGIKDLEDRNLFVRSSSFDDFKKKWIAIFAAIAEGKIQMSQIRTTVIGYVLNKNFMALDLPFLFEDQEHVSRVLDSEIGEELLEELSLNNGIKGLSFTYNYGCRVVGSNHVVRNLEDLSESLLITTTDPTQDFFENLGINTVDRSFLIENVSNANEENVAVETDYLEFFGKSVLKTNHGIFSTGILTGNKFWDSLDYNQQNAFKESARAVSRMEKNWIDEAIVRYEQRSPENNITIFDISFEEKNFMKEISKINYESADMNYEPGLVKRILERSEK